MTRYQLFAGWLVATFVVLAAVDAAVGQQPIEAAYLPPTSSPHLVIQSPQLTPKHVHGHKHGQVTESVVVDDAGAVQPNEPAPSAHDSLHEKIATHFLHEDKTPPPVAIPNAVRTPVWKMPYSYGYFGASRSRQWTLHHGHQETYTQWTLR